MSDTNVYVNAYLDHSVGMIHENITQILQLRTQNKLATDLLKQKEELVASLQQELDKNKTQSEEWHKNADSFGVELNKKRDEFKKLEDECNALRGKASHLDSISSQLNNTNQELARRTGEVDQLKAQVDALKKDLDTKNQELAEKTKELDSKTQENQELVKKIEASEKERASEKPINTKARVVTTKIVKDKPKQEPEETDDF